MPFANNNGIKIHCEVAGQGVPILFQHGLSGTLDYFHRNGFIHQELSKEYQCVFLSARGRGNSDKNHDPKAYYYRNQVLDLIAVLVDAKIEKAHYIGNSMGGVIGFRIPMYTPKRFYSFARGSATYMSSKITQNLEDIEPTYDALQQAARDGEENPMSLIIPVLEKAMGLMSLAQAEILAQGLKALTAGWQARKEEPFVERYGYLGGALHYCVFCIPAKATRASLIQ